MFKGLSLGRYGAAAALLIACSNGAGNSESVSASNQEIVQNNVTATLKIDSSWGQGYCATVSLVSAATSEVTGWSVTMNLNGSTVSSLWNGSQGSSGGSAVVTPVSHNRVLAPGGTVSFGFCASGSGQAQLVSITTGSPVQGTGGASSTGGATATGGRQTGGVTSTGGAIATGGRQTGGATSTGGATNTGGTNGSVCTDTPRSGETCANAKAWGFCGQGWFEGYCKATCGVCNGPVTGTGGAANGTGGAKATGGSATGGAKATGGAVSGTGGNSNVNNPTVPRLVNGAEGRTTRYWDCCKPSCGWSANAAQNGKQPARSCGKDGSTIVGPDTRSSCDGGSAYQCFSGAPWEVSPTLSYGYAATGGGNQTCGRCYQLDFTGAGDNGNASALSTKTMIVQAINIGGDVGTSQFDLLIPGGGVGLFNACTGSGSVAQWGNVNGGVQYGGFLSSCGSNMTCVMDMCQSAFGSKPELMAGCRWFTTWFNGASNPRIRYAEVPCPSALTSKSGM